MNYTTNYNLNKPEGTDLYNHLTVDNPNMDTIDGALHANKLEAIGNATELVSGTIHAITRADSDQNIFKFKATGDFHLNDTITVDGVTVNAYTTGGQPLPDEAYVLSAEVICILDGASLWVVTNKTPNVTKVVHTIPANTYSTMSEALDALKPYCDIITNDELINSFIIYGTGKYDYTEKGSTEYYYTKVNNVDLTRMLCNTMILKNTNSEFLRIVPIVGGSTSNADLSANSQPYDVKLVTVTI